MVTEISHYLKSPCAVAVFIRDAKCVWQLSLQKGAHTSDVSTFHHFVVFFLTLPLLIAADIISNIHNKAV
jgi:hypothetical protein